MFDPRGWESADTVGRLKLHLGFRLCSTLTTLFKGQPYSLSSYVCWKKSTEQKQRQDPSAHPSGAGKHVVAYLGNGILHRMRADTLLG